MKRIELKHFNANARIAQLTTSSCEKPAEPLGPSATLPRLA
jgi:hypothetical protein